MPLGYASFMVIFSLFYLGGDAPATLVAANDDFYTDDYALNNGDGQQSSNADDGTSSYQKEKAQYENIDDDKFHWNQNIGFDGVSIMPLSCINYNNGHMIKFQLYDSNQSYQCHFAEISTFVVSVAHYMRAYFNYQALVDGQSFALPSDAAYLNCVQLESGNSASVLYGKIGCMERETYTSTKLQLHVYTDAQCSQPYDDGQSSRKHAAKGFIVGNNIISSKISFRPPFYSCLTCSPDQVSESFNKQTENWYDDDYIADNSQKRDQEGDNGSSTAYEDKYYSNKDDVSGDGAAVDDDYYGGRLLTTSKEDLQSYRDTFWNEYERIVEKRSLYDNYDVGEWNMCQRIYKYGVWCDEECRSLDFFRTDEWSTSDIALLAIMCTFLTGMMVLIVAKRLKAQHKARIYGDFEPMPGLPPFAMAVIFLVTITAVVILAKFKFVNETLVFAVATCILLFIYMLKLTLFESRRPVILATPRHEIFGNPLDDHLMT
jgi:hypothetical protein